MNTFFGCHRSHESCCHWACPVPGAEDSRKRHVVLFIILYKLKVVLRFEFLDENNKCHILKATEQYFPAVLFIMLYKVVLPFESVDEIFLMVVPFK